VKLVHLLPFGAVAAGLAIAACDGVPDVTFPTTGDASTTDAANGGDGSPSNADGSNNVGSDGSMMSGTDGSMSGTDGSTSGTDAGKDAGKDSGSGVDAGIDGGCTGGSVTCCGGQGCIRCTGGKCNSCPMDCADPAKPVCCYDSQGNGTLTCVAAGQTCS
jgi:hypothetical protein